MVLQEYYDALDRLKAGRPKHVPKGTNITNDSVSLEAGRKKGSIKRSRPQFAELIAAIDAASQEQNHTPEKELATKLAKQKDEAKNYRQLYEEALGREQSLAAEVFRLRLELAKLTGSNVIPIQPQPNKS